MISFVVVFVLINIISITQAHHFRDFMKSDTPMFQTQLDREMFSTKRRNYLIPIIFISRLARFVILIYFGVKTQWLYAVSLYFFAWCVTHLILYFIYVRSYRQIWFRLISYYGFYVQPILLVIIWFLI